MTFPLLPFSLAADASAFEPTAIDFIGKQLIFLQSKDQASTLVDLIKSNFSSSQFHVLVAASTQLDLDDFISLLNAGAATLFANAQQVSQLAQAGISGSRVISYFASVSELSPNEVQNSENSGALVTIQTVEEIDSLKDISSQLSKQLGPEGGAKHLYIDVPGALVSDETVQKIISISAIPVVSKERITAETVNFDEDSTVESTAQPGLISAAKAFLSAVKSDRTDGLFTTLVVDANDKTLGLVYSSPKSVSEAFRTATGVYESRRHGLWYKGATSGAVQKLLRADLDCDGDCIRFIVEQTGPGFCHNNTMSCFGAETGVTALEKTLIDRKINSPQGSYTKRLYEDEKLLTAKIMEEAEELTQAESKEDVAWEAADLIYFALTKIVKTGVRWSEVERNLDAKSLKVSRRRGDAKPKWIAAEEKKSEVTENVQNSNGQSNVSKTDRIAMSRLDVSSVDSTTVENVLKRPVMKTADIMKLVGPIVESVREGGDKALLEFTHKFDKVQLKSPILQAPFAPELMQLTPEIKAAIDLSISNVRKFHEEQKEKTSLSVETVPGVICSRFARAIESVGLYIPGGTAVLPSTALMLGVPAQVAGCKNIILASPPRSDGTLTPEVVYVAHKVGAKAIVLAGGAQAVAALAYGTESVDKVDKIFGPGNQFVTAAKMFVQNDTRALVSVDMPAGPSEVLVIADSTAVPAFVASDLLSQAEHGVDSQVMLVAVGLKEAELKAIEDELHEQALRLPRVDIVRGSIAHSTTLIVKTIDEAIELSNRYGPEHLILQVENAASLVDSIQNAGSVFVGSWSPESCGDYSSGTNHTLPTYGYSKMYSGVNTLTFMKHITSQELTREGLENIGNAVMTLAAVEGLDAHRNAVKVRLEHLQRSRS